MAINWMTPGDPNNLPNMMKPGPLPDWFKKMQMTGPGQDGQPIPNMTTQSNLPQPTLSVPMPAMTTNNIQWPNIIAPSNPISNQIGQNNSRRIAWPNMMHNFNRFR